MNINKIFYYSPQVTFSEVPDEISLTIPTLCYKPHCSEDCNSKSLCWAENWKGEKKELTKEILKNLILENEGISCVTIMTSLNFKELKRLFSFVKKEFPNLKTAIYIGLKKEEIINNIDFFNLIKILDYIKVGSFKKEFGPLNNPNTNQRFYKINHANECNLFEDITYKFIEKLF